MTFLFDDKKLIDELVKAAEKSALKTAQQQAQIPEAQIQSAYQQYVKQQTTPPPGYPGKFTPPPYADYNTFKTNYIHQQTYQQQLDKPQISPQALASYKLAKKLLLGLRSTVITDPNDPDFVKKSAPLDFGAAQAPDIKPENLKTLGDFLMWSATNKIVWDGKRIAWDYNPGDPDANPPVLPSGEEPDIENPWVFQSYQKDRDRDQYTRQAVMRTYYANKDALLKFLTYLRDTPTARENKVFEVMIGKIIGQVNTYLQPNEQIGPRPEDKPSAQFNDGDIVDGFPSEVMDIKKAYEGIETYAPAFNAAPQKLTYGDIKDFGSLQNWVGGMRDAAHPDKNPTAPDGYACGIIHILYLRAKYLSGQARYDRLRPKYSALAKVYLDNVTNFGKQFTDGGQPCAVTQPGTQAPQQPGQQPGQQGQPGQMNPRALQELAALRPFNTENIDFREIKLFLDRYNQLANKPGIDVMVGQVKNSMNEANRLLGTTDAPIQLGNMTTAVVRNWTNQPVPLLNTLYTIISYSGRVYQDFFNEFKRILGDEAARPVEQQIASGGPQQSNLTDIMDVRSSFMNEAQSGGRR